MRFPRTTVLVAVAISFAMPTVGLAQAPSPATESPKAQPATRTLSLSKPKMEIYGRLHMSFDGASLEDSPNSTQYLQLSSNTSLIGFRGSADLGIVQGLWQVESNVTVTNGVTSAIGVGSRDTFVGLGSEWGTVKAGFFYGPYYYAVDKLDPMAWTIADMRSVIHNTGWGGRVEFSTRLTNTVQYASPKFSGFQVAVQYANPEQTTGANGPKRVAAFAPNPGDGDVLGGVYSASVTYGQGPLYAAIGYEIHNAVDRLDDAIGIEKEQAFEVGVGYTLPTKTTITAIYEGIWRSGADDGAIRTRPIALFASVKQDIGEESLVISGAYAGSSKAPGANDGGGFIGVGWFHNFAKSTQAYLAFAKGFNAAGAQWGLGTQGHGTRIDPNQPGKGPMALSIGVIHRFSVGL